MTSRRLNVLVGVAALALGFAPLVHAEGPLVIEPSQRLAVLLNAENVVAAPGARPASIGVVLARRPITGEQTVLPVIGSATSADGGRWLRVMLPGRPNGHTGWINGRGTAAATTSWHLVIRTSSRRLLVYRRGRLVCSFLAVVGKPSTPTPHGQFFVEESVRMPPRSAGGPFALALSARSDMLQEFDGGPGQIAIHGVMELVGTPGTAVSHGCIRLDDHDIRWLSARIETGTPVTIIA